MLTLDQAIEKLTALRNQLGGNTVLAINNGDGSYVNPAVTVEKTEHGIEYVQLDLTDSEDATEDLA